MITIKVNKSIYDLDNIKGFLSLLFNNNEDIELNANNNILLVSVSKNGRTIHKSHLPVNIKDRDTLGWHSADHNLCLLPLKNGNFIMKVGCKSNRAIRPLINKGEVDE